MARTVKALVALDANKLLGLKQVCKVSAQPIDGALPDTEGAEASRLLSKVGEVPTVEISRLLSKIGEIQ